MAFPDPEFYRLLWRPWIDDPMAEQSGVSFDRTDAGVIRAAAGRVLLCAWHIDRDERPTCWMDVASLAEALHVRDHFAAACTGNVDVLTLHDAEGGRIGEPARR